jgi:hypothetical protein
MMPDLDPLTERRKKRGRAAGLISTATIVISTLFHPGWAWLGTDPENWVLFAVSIVVVVAVALSADLPSGRGRGGRGRRGPERGGPGSGSVLSGRGRDDRQAGAAVRRWRMLAFVSRLMPRSAGRRWLAEAESLLSEIAPVQRGPALRSYLLSAPRLAVMMWAREAQWRARLGPRRPG